MSSEENSHRKRNNYKLLVDPELQKGHKKLYRINGAIPGQPPIGAPSDPRVQKTLLGANNEFRLPVPLFKYDKHWQGPPPERDVFIIGLNDLAQSDSLKDVCAQFGSVHSLRMHRHPKTKAFLGAATVLYSQAGSARKAVQEIDGKIIAGCYLKADLDDKGEHLMRYLEPVLKDIRNSSRADKSSSNHQDRTSHSLQSNSTEQQSNSDHTPNDPTTPKTLPVSHSMYPFSSLNISSESPSTIVSPLVTPHTPSSVDSGISMKPSFDPVLALKASLNLAPAKQSLTSPSSLPPLPPEDKPAPPPPPLPPPPPSSQEGGIENISSDEATDKQNTDTTTHHSPQHQTLSNFLSPVSLSPPLSAKSTDNLDNHFEYSFIHTRFKPFTISRMSTDPRSVTGHVKGCSYDIEVEEISGDESPVMVYNTELVVEQVTPDDDEAADDRIVSDDMDISDDDTINTNIIEVNIHSSAKPAQPHFPPPLPAHLPPLPPPPPPPPMPFPLPVHGYYPPPDPAYLPPFPPPLPPTLQPPGVVSLSYNGYSDCQGSVSSQSTKPRKPLSPGRCSQQVLVKALEQLASIVRKDLERKMVESSAFPVLDTHWEKREKQRSGDLVPVKIAEEEEEVEKPKKAPEPYRRMLPGMVVGGADEESGAQDTPITPRKKLINFKIPLLARGNHRRSHPSMMARRRLYEDEDRDSRKRQGRHRHRRPNRPSRSFLSSLSDISSEDFSEEEEEEEESKQRKRRRQSSVSSEGSSESSDESLAGPRTPPSGPHTPSGEDSELKAVFGTESEEEDDDDDDDDDEEWIRKLELLKENKTRKRRLNSSVACEDQVLDTKPKRGPIGKENFKTTAVASPVVKQPKVLYKKRSQLVEEEILRAFLSPAGPDKEDVQMMKLALSELSLQGEECVEGVSWSHYPSIPASPPPPLKQRRRVLQDDSHSSGSARCEGYYKINQKEKSQYLPHLRRSKTGLSDGVNKKKLSKSGRGNRLNHRRVASLFGSGDMSREVQQYNQLKARKKLLKFAKSTIHNWGLFALENIGADEMVIEYVGEMVRQAVADDREKRYEAQGVGSSYLFRVDMDYIIDATKRGNMARFINHCCDPNCYARVITIGAHKKIVIYSKRDIAMGEEITYDYKFPIEDEKIPCLCGAPQCRGTLN